jgi:hypothetical protein
VPLAMPSCMRVEAAPAVVRGVTAQGSSGTRQRPGRHQRRSARGDGAARARSRFRCRAASSCEVPRMWTPGPCAGGQTHPGGDDQPQAGAADLVGLQATRACARACTGCRLTVRDLKNSMERCATGLVLTPARPGTAAAEFPFYLQVVGLGRFRSHGLTADALSFVRRADSRFRARPPCGDLLWLAIRQRCPGGAGGGSGCGRRATGRRPAA